MKGLCLFVLSLALLAPLTLAQGEIQQPVAKSQPAQELKADAPTMTAIVVKSIDSMVVFKKQVKGSLDQTQTIITQVLQEAKNLQLQVIGPPLGFYENSPAEVKPADLNWAIAMPIKEKTEVQLPEGYEFEVMASFEAAVTTVTGPYSEMGKAYSLIYKWIGENKYVPNGPTMERWLNDPASTPPEQLQSEIIIPVTRLIPALEESKPKTEGAVEQPKETLQEPEKKEAAVEPVSDK